jgi:hypothetical protein
MSNVRQIHITTHNFPQAEDTGSSDLMQDILICNRLFFLFKAEDFAFPLQQVPQSLCSIKP